MGFIHPCGLNANYKGWLSDFVLKGWHASDKTKFHETLHIIAIILLTGISQVPSHVLMGIPHGALSPKQTMTLTCLGEACSRLDLTAIHEILEKVGYKDDEGIANEVSNDWCLTSFA